MLESGDDLGMGGAQPRDDKRIVSDLTGSLKRFPAERAAIDRRVGLLDRLWTDRQGRHLPEFALICKGVLSPGASDNCQGLFVAGATLGLVNTKSFKMLGNNPASGPEVEPTVAQDIEHGKVFGFS